MTAFDGIAADRGGNHMTVSINYVPALEETPGNAGILQQLKALLRWGDEQFVPPLSARHSSTQSDLAPHEAAADHAIDDYYQALLEQRFLLALDDSDDTDADADADAVGTDTDGKRTLAGFMSYRPDYACAYVDGGVCTYVSTILVAGEYRGAHLTERMYRELFALPSVAGTVVATRTWSENGAHLHILKEMGFDLIKTLPDDRGPGIDTVYYAKRV